MPGQDAIIYMLSLAGLDINEFYSRYGKKKLRDAILYAKGLKDRYSVLWMYYDFYGEA